MSEQNVAIVRELFDLWGAPDSRRSFELMAEDVEYELGYSMPGFADRYRGHDAIRAFWRRRMVRLLPALATLVVAFLCVTPLLSEPPKAPLLQSVASLLYFSDYLRAFTKVPDYLIHTWSLAVEAKFYLIWPLVLIFCATRMAPEALWKTILLLAIFATSWRLLNVQLTTWDLVYFRADTRISGLLLGSALAAATRAGIRPKLPVWSWISRSGVAVGRLLTMLTRPPGPLWP